MSKSCTGAYSTGESLPIEMSYLFKNGYIRKGLKTLQTIIWTDLSNGEKAACISVISDFTGNEKSIRLIYETTYQDTGERKSFDYKITIVGVPSNLGKGEVLYFLCPKTGRKCRILYKAYDSDIWQSRESYDRRIYYPLQQCSKFHRHNTKYWMLDCQITELLKKKKTDTYNGKLTKSALRTDRKIKEILAVDKLRQNFYTYNMSIKCYYIESMFHAQFSLLHLK